MCITPSTVRTSHMQYVIFILVGKRGHAKSVQIPVGIAQNTPRGLISIGIASVYPVLQKASRQAIQWQPSKDSVVLVFLQTLG